ncbi:unnamed protein product [Spirodela intermedia]|uniref:Uncharacterized protein n=1 Tax=Spirodela intermedia TaxID=51605 RepID=A0A7I8J3C4_SPIIN|nr:unnamed protein product [Spirodela intermedia]CAA6664472.1 unnamed protein product [Spirodela intermedia]
MLLSKRAAGDYRSGFYNFKFNDDNRLLASAGHHDLYQGRTNFNSSRVAILDDKGFFLSSDHLNFSSSDYGPGPSRRLTLDHDGLLRLYSLNEFPRADPEDWSRGCRPEFNLTCATGSVDFIELRHTDYYGNDLDSYNCSCQGFGFHRKICYPKYALLNGHRMPRILVRMYIKVPTSMAVREQMAIMIILGWRFIRRIHRNLGPAENGHRFQFEVGFRRFTYAELKAMTRNFNEEIGRGGFGSVYRGPSGRRQNGDGPRSMTAALIRWAGRGRQSRNLPPIQWCPALLIVGFKLRLGDGRLAPA